MSRARYSEIAHTGIRFWNPLDEQVLVGILATLPLHAGARILDYGCGRGEVLVELARRCVVQITGIDPNAQAIQVCRSKVDGRFLEQRFEPGLLAPESFDVVINIGASPGFRRMIGEVAPLVAAGGRVLVGDGYWRRLPSRAYLDFLGVDETHQLTHEGNLEALRAAGFATEKAVCSDLDAWDRYEDRYDGNMRAFLAAHPDDPQHAEFEGRRSQWRAMYLEHGRATLGFALYQARRAFVDIHGEAVR